MSSESATCYPSTARTVGIFVSTASTPHDEQLQLVRVAIRGKLYEAYAVRTPDLVGALSGAVTEYEICLVRHDGLRGRAIIMSIEEIWVPGGLAHFPDDLCPVNGVVSDIKVLVDRIATVPLHEFVCDVLQRRDVFNHFWVTPASARHHHAFPGGLASHSLQVARDLAGHSTLTQMERDLGVAGALFHDIGKIWSYTADMFLTKDALALGHELLGLTKLTRELAALENKWPDGANAMRAMLSGQSRPRDNGSLPSALIARIKACDQRSCERDGNRRTTGRSWIPTQWQPDADSAGLRE